MTNDELTERHVALTQSLELLLHDVQQDAENIRTLARNSQILHDSIQRLENIAGAARNPGRCARVT